MATFFSQTSGQDRAETVARVLEIQAEAYGYLDIPILLQELNRYSGGNALDIGTGDGSFLLKIAEKNPTITYLGIEPNAELLAKAESRLAKMRLPNVQLRQAEFDSEYKNRYDVILARFTLQHTEHPRAFVQNVYDSLPPGGGFFCIEPVYDYYDCEPPQKIWQEFRARILATYERWKSHPNVPKQACQWLSDSGFESISASINIYSPITIGRNRFAAVVLATAAMLNFQHPDIWEASFLEKLERWLKHLDCDPFIAIAHIRASKPKQMSRTEQQSSIQVRLAAAEEASSIAAVLHQAFIEYESLYRENALGAGREFCQGRWLQTHASEHNSISTGGDPLV